MRIRKRFGIALVFPMAIWVSSTLAVAPLGPPMAVLEEGQWAFGGQYSHRNADYEARGIYRETVGSASPSYAYEQLDLDDLASHAVFGHVAYGICDNWDVFVRLGLADARGDMTLHAAPGTSNSVSTDYSGGHGVAYGFGTRAAFCRWGPWTFGGLAQATWINPDSDDYIYPDATNTVSIGRTCIDAWEAQVALAAFYQIDTLHFWAGPFLQFTEGSYDRKGRIYVNGVDSGSFKASGDIRETARVGVHCGLSWEASPRFRYQTEGQFTGDSWLLGFGLMITPERLKPQM